MHVLIPKASLIEKSVFSSSSSYHPNQFLTDSYVYSIQFLNIILYILFTHYYNGFNIKLVK